MKLIHNPQKLQRLLRKERARGKRVGFVPTMGALHDGHLSLVRAANLENDLTVVSIFVNPTQFGPKEDYLKYPRVIHADKKKLQQAKVDYLFCPSAADMYPEGYATFVEVAPGLTGVLCGKYRPGHFRGVATVVTKLLNIIGVCRLYLGAKDYQQVTILRRVVRDLDMAIQVRMRPTVREKDGLAMSSRNRFLSSAERQRALSISRTLLALKQDLLEKKGTVTALRDQALRQLRKSVDQVQYLEIVDPVTLCSLKQAQRKMAALAACFVGKTRLIDNVTITL